ncbi:unnamed protein product [Orchesella dallaii]|uniref:Uncharacterized protein n=1 Tax=Orchesella dallaii TaxID=48710 RepID=A0ABP1QWE9_9HEXA
MNIPCVNDDEDFPVFKAGPPLPIRTKSHIKSKNAPLKATTAIKPSTSSSFGTTTTNPAESKVKQYIERVKANDELGRQKRIKPAQMLSLEDLYQVNVTTPPSLSKSNSQNLPSEGKRNATNTNASVSEMHEKLRETMRIVKEKDELINKLRESCHDLAIKCADAENRVDELRFSFGRSSSTTTIAKGSHLPHHRGSISGGELSNQVQSVINSTTTVPRRCASVEDIHMVCGESDGQNDNAVNVGQEKSCKMIDKATETAKEGNVKHDVQTQIEVYLCQDDNADSEQEVGHWEAEDHILTETCSNWYEKVKNWKTDSAFNLSQDSCGDRDSGFRGSAEIETESARRQRRYSLPRCKGKCQGHRERLNVPCKTDSTHIANIPTSLSTAITEQGPPNTNLEESNVQSQHFWPSFNTSQPHFHLNHHSNDESLQTNSTKAKSLFYELAEAERNKYAHFHEEYSKRQANLHHHHMKGAKSLDGLYIAATSHQTTEELRSLIDSSYEPPEYILNSHLKSQHRSIDKKMKLLEPLLHDTTQIALRVKRKSEKLAKMLQDACTYE